MSLEDELVHFARDQMRISEHYVAKCLSIWEAAYGRKVVEKVKARIYGNRELRHPSVLDELE